MMKTIELDCPPGGPRPGDLIAAVVKGTSLENSSRSHPDATVSRLFGNWVWSFPDVTDEEWKNIQEITSNRIRKLHAEGIIRYGSW